MLIEKHGLVVKKLFMNKRTYLKFCKAHEIIDDPLSKDGYMGGLWNMDILVNDSVPRNKVYCCAEAEFVGVMPMFEDATVYGKKIKGKTRAKDKLKVCTQERIGMAVLNVKGVSVLNVKEKL